MAATVLIVDDEKNILVTLARALQVEGYNSEVAGSAEIALDKLSEKAVDLVLMDVKMPGMGGLAGLEAMRAAGHQQPVVMMSGHGTIDTAVQAVQGGAADFIEKPVSTERLLVSLQNALRLKRLVESNTELQAAVDLGGEILGSGPAIAALKSMIEKAAPSEGRVLISGENGTGKELVARAIHFGSPRHRGPFVKLNCAAVPSELIESELFGHEKGAFTGAIGARKGKFELADGGTLLLDEVGDMPPNMQAKLLRVLQEGEFERVGATTTQSVDVRVIASTNRDLEEMVATGTFREDLYYRLNVVPLRTPSLRERKEDIAMLAEHFLVDAARRNRRRGMSLDEGGLSALCAYDYPGNVRELRNIIERLVILSDGKVVTREVVTSLLPGGRLSGTKGSGSVYRPNVPLRDLVADAEREIITAALADHQGNMTETARALGLERSHLYKKCKALGLRKAE